MKISGIDEAGRGPVIGPMVIACVMCDEKDLHKISALGVKDSKQLSPKRRSEIYEILKKEEYIKTAFFILSPKEIDNAVLSENFNLNWLEAINSSMLLNKLKPEKAILDCPSTNIKDYVEYVKKNLNIKCEIIAEHKADQKYTIVSAASIIAKVIRDKEIEKIKREIDFDFGSGYPSDPKTIAFIKENYNNPKLIGIFRKSWASYRNLLEKKENKKTIIKTSQKRLEEF